jgi:phosphotransferase system HPr-like phosphotransfer protein
MLALLALRLGEGEVVRLEGDGAGAERAVASLADLLAHDPVEGTPPR